MPSLLLVVFILQLAIFLVNKFGAATINELLWILYNKLPTPTAKAVHDGTRLKLEVIRIKKEMSAVSAQDDFARWAKIRRQHDKAVAVYDKNAATLTASKTQFDRLAAGVRWLGTNGFRFLLQFWFSKSPMFWVPSGWVPGYVEWVLSFPRAPIGSISIQIWAIACASIIAMVSEAVIAGYALVEKQRTGGAKQAQAFEMNGMGTPGRSATGTPKKEL